MRVGSPRFVFGAALLAIALPAASVRAQRYTVTKTLQSPSPAHDEYLGVSVGVAADVIAVGTSYHSSRVYVFDAASGTLRYTLTAPVGRTRSFGEWLTGVGNYLAVGDPALFDDGVPGVVLIYDAATGALLHTITAPDGTELGQNVVPAAGNILASGGTTALLIDPGAGTVLQSFPTPYQSYGEPLVAGDGTYVLIGSPTETVGNETAAGRARLYNAASGTLVHTFASPSPIVQGRFGHSVALVGNLAAVRAFDGSGASRIHLFDVMTGGFVRTLALATTPASWLMPMGASLLVGANFAPPFVTHRVDPTNGNLLATIADPEIGPPYSLALLGDRIVAGDPYAKDDHGLVRIFEPCGNGVLATGEECDDGNSLSGDGCAAECFIELCGAAPAPDCRSTSPRRASLSFSRESGRERFKWKMAEGEATNVGDYGTPPTTTSYAICLYDRTESATPALRMVLRAPAAGDCAGRPCWSGSASGFDYKDGDLTPTGVKSIKLRTVGANAQVSVKGKGADLDLPAAIVNGRVTVQLRRLGTAAPCWESSFSTFRENTTSSYSARSD